MGKTKGKAVGKGKQGCLGKDGKYSIENCKGYLINQGLGDTTGQSTSNITNQ